MTVLVAPATCIPDLTVSFDVNQDWPCKRAAFISMLHGFVADIDKTERMHGRATDPQVRANLTAWVADAEVRYARLLTYLPEKPCTCWQSGLYWTERERIAFSNENTGAACLRIAVIAGRGLAAAATRQRATLVSRAWQIGAEQARRGTPAWDMGTQSELLMDYLDQTDATTDANMGDRIAMCDSYEGGYKLGRHYPDSRCDGCPWCADYRTTV